MRTAAATLPASFASPVHARIVWPVMRTPQTLLISSHRQSYRERSKAPRIDNLALY
jgi:hypothetical protein